MIIEFKKMELKENSIGKTVQIEGQIVNPSGFKDKILIEMSILQLAKIWNTDKKIVTKLKNDFGSPELEDQCEKTKEKIRKFPNVEFLDKEIKIDDVYLESSVKYDNTKNNQEIKERIIKIFVEDIVGWGNEGIRMDLPKEIYDKAINRKEFKFILTPTLIKLEVTKWHQQ